MKQLFVILTVFVIKVVANTDCDETKCVGHQKLYKEIGCTPVIEEGQCCPSRYECPDLKNLDNTKCHYKNEIYDPRAELPSNMTNPLCAAACYCRESSDNEKASFNCANIECPELFNREPDCIYPVEKGDCCSKKKICGDDRKSLPVCLLDGVEYFEGQSMYPEKESCHKCTCTKDFNNSTIVDNPNCEEVDCGIQLRYMTNLQGGCVPIYYGTERCCPISWRCPESTDKVESKGKNSSESKHKCEFGSLKLNIGDELTSDEKDVSCACVSPPFVQCVKATN